MEFAGFELTLDRALLLLVLVFLVVNTVQQHRTQAAVQQTQQAVQQTRVEFKQFKEDVPHRELSTTLCPVSSTPPFPFLPHKTTSTTPILIRRSVYGDV